MRFLFHKRWWSLCAVTCSCRSQSLVRSSFCAPLTMFCVTLAHSSLRYAHAFSSPLHISTRQHTRPCVRSSFCAPRTMCCVKLVEVCTCFFYSLHTHVHKINAKLPKLFFAQQAPREYSHTYDCDHRQVSVSVLTVHAHVSFLVCWLLQFLTGKRGFCHTAGPIRPFVRDG